MIIYGENAVGKSTLLQALNENLEKNDGGNDVIFIGNVWKREYTEVISLFLRLLDHKIQRKLNSQPEVGLKSDRHDTVVLIDLPNLLLPREIQSQLLEYFRFIAKEKNENIQFIIVTDSRALIDKAYAEGELFMMMPAEQVEGGANQLVKVNDTNMCLPAKPEFNELRAFLDGYSSATFPK